MAAHKMSSFSKILIVFLCVLLLAVIAVIVRNRLSTDFDQLSAADQQILSELDDYCRAAGQKDIWSGYGLEDKTILAINGTFGAAYLIDPADELSSIFAQRITMPEGSSIVVYRLSALTPQVFSMRFEAGNFNTIGKSYSLFGSEVYFTRYTEADSLTPQYSSKHYITLLTHEAFHYYMQNNWPDGGRFSASLTDADIDLLEEEYAVLADIQTELMKDSPSAELLAGYAREYVSVMEQRIAANPEYLSAELAMETAEGTAQYVGIRASELAGYDYGVMYFDNVKDVSFSDVIPMLRSGGIDRSFLADRMPYETGALLCKMMEALGVDGWQDQLNAQTTDAPVYLYSVIRGYLYEE